MRSTVSSVHSLSRLPITIALSLVLSGCVFYPRKIERYDADCQIQMKTLVLNVGVTNATCSSHADCLALLGLSAGSAVISGSIVVVGNTIYWLERRGKCLLKPSREASEEM